MFDSWSYKKKNLVFLGSVVTLLLVGYFMAFSKTIGLYNANQYLQSNVSSLGSIQSQLVDLQAQKAALDSILGELDLGGGQQLLLKQMSSVTNENVVLAEYAEVKKRSSPDRYSLFKFEGSYQALVRLLYEVERRHYGGVIASAKFEVDTDRRTKMSRLYMSLYFKR